eukprot:TRINITY_DN32849_c0_g1_i1.p1 TRINITY_DN32849_c0_g1~~TRINITY_DN32849_c0_g1_i1.p1  ORF type:complete len:627 (+),score=110.64 TRINITY_DN32849_c0_g1_i1:53-1933(+)
MSSGSQNSFSLTREKVAEKRAEKAGMPVSADAEKRVESEHAYVELVRSQSSSSQLKPGDPENSGSPAAFGEDELYFGSVKAYLAPVPGSVIAYDHSQWQALTDQDSLQRVLARAEKMGPKGDIIVPAIPALDFGQILGVKGSNDEKVSGWPSFMRTPLIKVGKNIPESMMRPVPGGPEKAFASGVRSCVFKLDGQWYRLKGSGNNDEGFTVQSDLNSGKELTRQIRGSAWLHTAVRENFMAAQLASSMQPRGMLGANEAMGIYMYDAPNQPFGPSVSVPACIIEKTLGDRRLGTHVMAGMEIILPLLVDTSALVKDQIAAHFPPARRGLPAGGDIVVSTAALFTDQMMALEFVANGLMEPGTLGLEFNVPRDATVLCDGKSTALPYRKLEEGSYPMQWSRDGSKQMSEQWQCLWDTYVRQYNECLEKAGPKSVLGYLFSRIGNDCGRIMKGMHDARVSWGTYQDEICVDDSQWHCNAHANNVVVLAEGSSRDMFLGYLDLDMAFDDKTFVSVYGKGSPKGTVGSSEEAHALLLKREHINFLEVLTGGDTTSGVPMVAKDEISKHPKFAELEAVKSLLYDTLAMGYLNAYEGEAACRLPVAEFDQDMHRMAHLLIKLAIIVMADYIA